MKDIELYNGDCLEFLHYVDADVRDISYYDATTALTGLITSHIKDKLDSYGEK